jgi:hypothetical protein
MMIQMKEVILQLKSNLLVWVVVYLRTRRKSIRRTKNEDKEAVKIVLGEPNAHGKT